MSKAPPWHQAAKLGSVDGQFPSGVEAARNFAQMQFPRTGWILAENDVRRLWGVIGVSNDIAIKPKPNASNIRDNIMVALDRSWVDRATIDVTAEGGKVTLSGTVDTSFEREEAGSTAWAAPGTTSVQNDITVS
jgi:osmotically-inducible protein OsmY